MRSKINKILEDISKKREELASEYSKLKEKYGFKISKWKIVFNSEARKKNKKLKKPTYKSILGARISHVLSIPFIYAMIIPTVILHLFLEIYQNTAFRLYGIPLVKVSDYIVADRKHLDYLNTLQKFNCIYCSYVNGVFSFAVEVWGRTEKYWCPIKYASKNKTQHEWQKCFADYGDPEWFKEVFLKNEEFYKD